MSERDSETEAADRHHHENVQDSTGTVPHFSLLYLTLPYLTSLFLALPYLTLPYLTLLYLTLPCFTLPYLTLPCFTLPYLTLTYLTGKACYRLALRPPVGRMHIPELTFRLLKPLGVFSKLQECTPVLLS